MKTLNPLREDVETKYPNIEKIIDDNTIVINKADGVQLGSLYLIFDIENNKSDSPVTNQKIGYFEKVKGFGRVNDLKDNKATIHSANTEYLYNHLNNQNQNFTEQPKIPFHNLEIGDLAKLIAKPI